MVLWTRAGSSASEAKRRAMICLMSSSWMWARSAGDRREVEAEVFFEADDAVLNFEVVDAGFQCEDQEGRGDDDPPKMKIPMMRPVMNSEVDRDAKVDKEDR